MAENLAACLDSLGTVQRMMGLRAEAFGSMHEALELQWHIFTAEPINGADNLDVIFGHLCEYYEEIAVTPPDHFLERLAVFHVKLRALQPPQGSMTGPIAD